MLMSYSFQFLGKVLYYQNMYSILTDRTNEGVPFARTIREFSGTAKTMYQSNKLANRKLCVLTTSKACRARTMAIGQFL